MRNIFITTLILCLALNTILVSAQINTNNRAPKNDFSTEVGQKVIFQLGVKSDDAAIASVIFILKNPNCDVLVEAGDPNSNGRYKLKKKPTDAGIWQWMVIITDSNGGTKTLSWRDLTVGSDTVAPTPAPTPTPSLIPTPTPSLIPSPSPTSAPIKPPTPPRIAEAAADIRSLLSTDVRLGAKFLRLGFHMCVGGCDGCVDMTNVDNRGLDVPIDAIRSIVNTYSGNLSRADIWALATLISVEEGQKSQDRVSFPFEWFGRSDCSGSSDGKSGPAQSLPSPDLTTHQLFEFFRVNFGFTKRETVALMGAHTIGQLNKQNSGFDGPLGWAQNNDIVNNAYFKGLVGGDTNQNLNRIPIEELISARNWDRENVNNNNVPGIPDRHVWVNTKDGDRTLMTNTDIALVRDFSGQINGVGQVSCAFKGRNNPCPHFEETLRIAAEFKWDQNKWLEEFRDVLGKMFLKGYNGNVNCFFPPCQVS